MVYAIASDGQLLQFDTAVQEWADLGRPTWAGLGPAEGVSIVNEETGDRSLFLLSDAGTLVELFYSSGGSTGEVWHWHDHGCPDGDHIVGPPGGLINMRSLFMVTASGTVYERYWDGSRWIWVSHGHSGGRTLPARPVALDNRHIFFLREDHLLTERFWNGIEWVWSIHRVPDFQLQNRRTGTDKSPGSKGESVAFCNPEVGVRDSCAPPMFENIP